MKEVFSDLVDFIHKQSRAYDIPITMETSIENDLGITGDDESNRDKTIG